MPTRSRKKIQKAKTDPEPLPSRGGGPRRPARGRQPRRHLRGAGRRPTKADVLARVRRRPVLGLQEGAGRAGGGEDLADHSRDAPAARPIPPRSTACWPTAAAAPRAIATPIMNEVKDIVGFHPRLRIGRCRPARWLRLRPGRPLPGGSGPATRDGHLEARRDPKR